MTSNPPHDNHCLVHLQLHYFPHVLLVALPPSLGLGHLLSVSAACSSPPSLFGVAIIHLLYVRVVAYALLSSFLIAYFDTLQCLNTPNVHAFKMAFPVLLQYSQSVSLSYPENNVIEKENICDSIASIGKLYSRGHFVVAVQLIHWLMWADISCTTIEKQA